MAAMQALSEWPDLVEDVFQVQTVNTAGIYAIKFYIRGKPWIVTVDDEMMFYINDLYFA